MKSMSARCVVVVVAFVLQVPRAAAQLKPKDERGVAVEALMEKFGLVLRSNKETVQPQASGAVTVYLKSQRDKEFAAQHGIDLKTLTFTPHITVLREVEFANTGFERQKTAWQRDVERGAAKLGEVEGLGERAIVYRYQFQGRPDAAGKISLQATRTVYWVGDRTIYSMGANISCGCPPAAQERMLADFETQVVEMARFLNGRLNKSMAGTRPERIGVGMVPFLNNGDDVEKAMHAVVGNYPEVKYLFNPSSAEHFFELLAKLRREGKLIDTLVIGGHGARETPGIQFKDGSLDATAVDLATPRRRAVAAERALNDPANKQPDVARKALAEARARIEQLEAVAAVMAPNAQVLLVNCSTAGTPEGQALVMNLGQVLLGHNGGTIVASKTDVDVDQVKSLGDKLAARWRTGEWPAIGEFFISGEWVKHVVPATRVTALAGIWRADGGREIRFGTDGSASFVKLDDALRGLHFGIGEVAFRNFRPGSQPGVFEGEVKIRHTDIAQEPRWEKCQLTLRGDTFNVTVHGRPDWKRVGPISR